MSACTRLQAGLYVHWDVKWASPYINPLSVNSAHLFARRRGRTDINSKSEQTGWWRQQTARKSPNPSVETRCAERRIEKTWTSGQETDFLWEVLCAVLILPVFFEQVSKPLMEKKRRARINKCLDQLKLLLESFYSSNVRGVFSKLFFNTCNKWLLEEICLNNSISSLRFENANWRRPTSWSSLWNTWGTFKGFRAVSYKLILPVQQLS